MCLGENLERKRESICPKKMLQIAQFPFFYFYFYFYIFYLRGLGIFILKKRLFSHGSNLLAVYLEALDGGLLGPGLG